MQKPSFFIGLGTGIISVSLVVLLVYSIKSTTWQKDKVALETKVEEKTNEIKDITIELESRIEQLVNENQLLEQEIISKEKEVLTLKENNVAINNEKTDEVEESTENSQKDSTSIIDIDTSAKTKEIEIGNGLTSMDIAVLLKENEIIDEVASFHTYLEGKEATTKLKAGSFVLPVSGNYDDVLEILLK